MFDKGMKSVIYEMLSWKGRQPLILRLFYSLKFFDL